MIRILKASKDTYITDKIVNGNRTEDANVGKAGTLDLFRLVGESLSGSVTEPHEISRLLVKFDLDPLRAMTGSILDLDHASFNCTLKMYDVIGGQTLPSNFNIIAFPLSHAFDEGIGRDVVSFADVDSCNFLTSSHSSGVTTLWFKSGSNKQGLLGSDDIDIIASGDLGDGNGVQNLWSSQLFADGSEDLSLDITTVVSATLKNIIPDHGFRLSFSGSEETDNRTRFVKRFISRHSTNPRLTPRIIVKYNDSTQDHHEAFYFDLSGSLFLNNYERGRAKDIVSGSSLTAITGANSLLLTLKSGSYSFSVTGSQHAIGSNNVTGTYSASFAIPSTDSTLRDEIISAGSGTFDEIWGSLDGTVGFHTGTLVIKAPNRTTGNRKPQLFVSIENMRSSYTQSDTPRMRVHVLDNSNSPVFVKTPVIRASEIFTNAHYRIRDAHNNDVIIDFDSTYQSTLLSSDADGMYFDLYMDSFDLGSVYTIDIRITDGSEMTFADVAKFRIVK